MFLQKTKYINIIFFKDNNQWKCQRNTILFEECYYTMFKVYITELSQYFVTATYSHEITL